MKRILYLKLLAGYVIFAILSFLTVATFTSHAALNFIQKDTASTVYRESKVLASNYAAN